MQKLHICFDIVANFGWVPVWIETVNGNDLVQNGSHVSLYCPSYMTTDMICSYVQLKLNSLFNAFNEMDKMSFLTDLLNFSLK